MDEIIEYMGLQFVVKEYSDDRSFRSTTRCCFDSTGEMVYMAVYRNACPVGRYRWMIGEVAVGIWGLKSSWMVAPIGLVKMPDHLKNVLPAYDFASVQDAIMFFLLNGGKAVSQSKRLTFRED